MKIFTQQSITEEVFENMQSNLIKNASIEMQTTSIHRLAALQKLSEAAELYDQIGNEKKANEVTVLIQKLVQNENQRIIDSQEKIAKIQKQTVKLAKLSESINNTDLNYHYLKLSSDKISNILNNLLKTSTYYNLNLISNALYNVNNISNPKDISLLNEILKIADDTLSAVEIEDETENEDEQYWEED